MAAQEKTQADVLADLDHVPGSVDSDMSEPRIPRVSSPEAGPGDKGKGAPQVGVEAPEETGLMQQPAQQQQADAGPGARTGGGAEGPPLVGADPDDEDDDEEAIGDEMDDEDDDDEEMDDEEEGLQLGEGATMAPLEAGDMSIEDEPFDTSILPDAHAGKAAWNRERLAAMPADDEGVSLARTPGSSEDMGYGGGAPNEDVDPDLPGLDTGDGMLDDLAGDVEEDEDAHVEDAAGALDASGGVDVDALSAMADAILGEDDDFADLGQDRDRGAGGRIAGATLLEHPDGQFTPSDNDDLDEGAVPREDLILAGEGEDPMFAGVEMGVMDGLDMEGLNETDDIARDLEDQRADMDDAASGNERQGQPG